MTNADIKVNSVNFRVVIEFLSACTNLLIMSVIVCNIHLSEELIIKNATKKYWNQIYILSRN